MHRTLFGLLAITWIVPIAALVAPSARALSLDPVSQTRSVDAQAVRFSPLLQENDSQSASDFSVFDATASALAPADGSSAEATATQTSSLGTTSVAADGSAVTMANYDGLADATSTFLYTFDLTEGARYSIFANVFMQPLLLGGDAAEAYVRLIDADANQILEEIRVFNGAGDVYVDSLMAEGVLTAGRYQLSAKASANAASGTEPDSSFDLSFTVVPEPGTALLVAGGLLGLAAGRERRC